MSHIARLTQIMQQLGYVKSEEDLLSDHLVPRNDIISQGLEGFLRTVASISTATEMAYNALSGKYSIIFDQETEKLVGELREYMSDGENVASVKYILGVTQGLHSRAKNSICEMYLVALVSAFETYLQEVMFSIFSNYTTTMVSNRSVTYEEVLTLDSHEDVVRYLARKEARKTTEGPVSEYLDKIDKKFGINLLAEPIRKAIGAVFAIRHVLVHNQGRIDRQFIKETKGNPKDEGKILLVDIEDASQASQIVALAVALIELQLVEQKFIKVAVVDWTDELEVFVANIRSFLEHSPPLFPGLSNPSELE